jgi:hypothetical protein
MSQPISVLKTDCGFQYFQRQYTSSPQWWYCVKSRKVAGSISDELIKFLNPPNPSSYIIILRSTQPLTEMNTGYLPRGTGRPARKADNLITICEQIFQKIWEPRRLSNLWVSMDCYIDIFTFGFCSGGIVRQYHAGIFLERLDKNTNFI